MNEFEKRINGMCIDGLHARTLHNFQVNLGLVCNQACRHCHLDCSPARVEVMSWTVMEQIIAAAEKVRPRLVDLTGGAPELNPDFRRLIDAMVRMGLAVQVRTNLTVLTEPGMESLGEYFRDNRVGLVGSMPCYLEENVRSQRGPQVYEKSVEAVRALNSLGYGIEPDLVLNLVYNPGGPFLPGDQAGLENSYRRELSERFGLSFTHLFTITNMPIGRFREELAARDKVDDYMELLRGSFNDRTVDDLMCRYQINFGWDGAMYDCDFNMALGCTIDHGAPDHVSSFDPAVLTDRRIVTGSHCFGCTAGAGSSCSGALAETAP